MRSTPSPKHAERMYKLLMQALVENNLVLNLDRSYLKIFCKAARQAFDVQIIFKKKLNEYDDDGLWRATRRIYIKSGRDGINKFATLLHELGHQYCHDNDIYKSYHEKDEETYATSAEFYVDNLAEMVFKKFFPLHNYPRSYFLKEKKK